MTDLTPDHPAVEAAMLEMTKVGGPLARTAFRSHALGDAAEVLEAVADGTRLPGPASPNWPLF